MPCRRTFLLLSVCALSSLFGSTSPGPAQAAAPAFRTQNSSAEPPSSPQRVIRTAANLVLVDVVVTTNGKPVEGLAAQQFHILENGKPQRISIFEEHRAADTPQVAQPPALPAGVYSNTPRFAVPSAANVLLLDALNTPLSDQSYVRQQMVQYLHRIPPGTRIAVFTLASRLRMIEGFTTDSDALETAITYGKGNPQQSAVLDSSEDQDALSDVANSMSTVRFMATSVRDRPAEIR